jgi:hypothetical protein
MNRRTMILMGTLSLIPFASDYSFGEDEHKKQQALIKARLLLGNPEIRYRSFSSEK